MTEVRRLKAVSALLALAAILTCSHVWGEALNKPSTRPSRGGTVLAPAHADGLDEGELVQSKFARGGMLTYRTTEGDLLFALQLKPRLEAVPARPRDYLVMVDTSASQVGVPLA